MSATTEKCGADERFSEDAMADKKREVEAMDVGESKLREIIRDEFQGHMKEMREEMSELFDNRIVNMATDILQKMETVMSSGSKDPSEAAKYCNRVKPSKEDVLPRKQFLPRNSMLTDLYEIQHIRTMYNVIVAVLIILLVHTAIYDIRTTGSPNFGIGTIKRGFAKLPIVLFVWTLMTCSTFGVYAAFCFWATHREQRPPKSFSRKIWDYGWLTALMVYNIIFIMLPTKAVLKEDLPVASSMIVLMELTRMLMKVYAFVRSVAPRFLTYKSHSDMETIKPPNFSKFLYFFFAPTLVYQDSYPRAKTIRWNVVLVNFAEVTVVIFCVGLMYERLLEPNFKDFGTQPVEWGMMMLNVLSAMFPGTMMFVCGFYCLLHSWMNAFAELLRFGDKMFYKDWWNSRTYYTYYRTWNIVVHDWLYAYIYKDMYEIVTKRNKILSIVTVFSISAIFHEYILSFTFRFFYPVMLSLFGGVGMFILFVLKSHGNIFFWFTLFVGNGVMASLYCMEHYARVNCPPTRDDFLDYLIPRSWTCIFQ